MILRWWQLAIRNWRVRFTRTLLESIAVVIACALIVTISSGFAAAESAFWVWHHRWVGDVDVRVSSATGRWFDQSKVDGAAGAEGVRRAAGGLRDHARLTSATDGATVSLKGRQIPESLQFQPMEFVAGSPSATRSTCRSTTVVGRSKSSASSRDPQCSHSSRGRLTYRWRRPKRCSKGRARLR